MTFKLNEVDDFENYITNKKQCPCEVYPISAQCETQFTECSAMRNWCSKGDYKDSNIQKHLRRAS